MASQNSTKQTLEEWAGSRHPTLALVFTDIVQSTELGMKLGGDKWINNLFDHFSMGRDIASAFESYIVKVIGDSLMVAFKNSSDAVTFSVCFAEDTAIEHNGIRVGVNSGEVEIRDNDIYGINVNFASRVQSALEREGVLVANSVREDYEKRFGEDSDLRFVEGEYDLKSFGKRTLHRVRTSSLRKSILNQRLARFRILRPEKVPPRAQTVTRLQ